LLIPRYDIPIQPLSPVRAELSTTAPSIRKSDGMLTNLEADPDHPVPIIIGRDAA
jgi:hypothetical protein